MFCSCYVLSWWGLAELAVTTIQYYVIGFQDASCADLTAIQCASRSYTEWPVWSSGSAWLIGVMLHGVVCALYYTLSRYEENFSWKVVSLWTTLLNIAWLYSFECVFKIPDIQSLVLVSLFAIVFGEGLYQIVIKYTKPRPDLLLHNRIFKEFA